MVRRKAWIDGLFIRICNELGFDNEGNAIVDPETSIYTLSTEGYFLHFAHSSQPIKNPRVWLYSGQQWEVASRDNEGIGMLFEQDWEDYGFITREDFDTLTSETKEQVRENIRLAEERAIRKAKAHM
jgi:hypothetical protein